MARVRIRSSADTEHPPDFRPSALAGCRHLLRGSRDLLLRALRLRGSERLLGSRALRGGLRCAGPGVRLRLRRDVHRQVALLDPAAVGVRELARELERAGRGCQEVDVGLVRGALLGFPDRLALIPSVLRCPREGV